jgi:hypothetical protein
MNDDAYFTVNSNTYYIILFIFVVSIVCIAGFIIFAIAAKPKKKSETITEPIEKTDQKL